MIKKLDLNNLDQLRNFTRQNFNDLACFSLVEMKPTLKNFTSWFNLEIYPYLKNGGVFGIYIRKELVGYYCLDFSLNQIYDLEEKVVLIRSLYVRPQSRGNPVIGKSLFKLQRILAADGYKKAIGESSVKNKQMNKIYKYFKGKKILNRFVMTIDSDCLPPCKDRP